MVVLGYTPFPAIARAVPLLLGTAAQESGLAHLRQVRYGPARGLFQMEPATEQDHWVWLQAHPAITAVITERVGLTAPSLIDLERNIPYQILMARLHYYRRDPAPLVSAGDLAGQALLWKRYTTRRWVLGR